MDASFNSSLRRLVGATLLMLGTVTTKVCMLDSRSSDWSVCCAPEIHGKKKA
jgi:hypothetical protein